MIKAYFYFDEEDPITSDILTNSYSKNEVYYNRLKASDGAVSFTVPYNSTLAAYLKTSIDSDVFVQIKDGDTNLATGYLHKQVNFERTQRNQPIAITLDSPSFMLDQSFDKNYVFENAVGYWEGDSGRSFPKDYLWTHTCFSGGSLMLSVADIPFGPLHFTGIIGIVYYNKKEYRFATYLGAHIQELRDGKVRIKQGNMVLEAGIIESSGKALNAPVGGSMIRTIHESASCKAYYKFRIKGKTVFSFKTTKASFEYEYPS